MSNSKHTAWLLEGVESWNARRDNWIKEGTPTLPDFSRMNLWWEFLDDGRPNEDWPMSLSGINLVEANLSHAMLRGVNFHNADFVAADLSDANLNNTDLTNAIVAEADLSDAYLGEARLDGADLRDALLTRADLTNSTVMNADLSTSSLVGADLTGTELWKAKLFPENKSPTQLNLDEMCAESIETLLLHVRQLAQHYEGHSEEVVFFFRGESQDGWKLRPSVARDRLIEFESKMLLDLLSRRPEEFSGMTSALSQWVLARHHGLKTRFLDITKNPLVAMFNACEKDLKKNGTVHVFCVPRSLIKSFDSDSITIVSNFAKLSREEQNLLLTKEPLAKL